MIKCLILIWASFFIPKTIDLLKNKDFARTRLAGLYKKNSKKEFLKSSLYLFKIHYKYWTAPLFIGYLLRTFLMHGFRVNEPIGNYFDPGCIAQYAVQYHHNSLLKLYLSLGFNPCFRDVACTTLFEYAFLCNNQEAGRYLAQHKDVVSYACTSVDWLDDEHEENMQIYGAFTLASPIFLVTQFFLDKFIIKRKIHLHKEGVIYLTFMIDDMKSQNFTGGLNYRWDSTTYKGRYVFGLKLFEKICLEEDFSNNDVEFLRNKDIDFPIGADDAGISNENCATYLNNFKNNLILQN